MLVTLQLVAKDENERGRVVDARRDGQDAARGVKATRWQIAVIAAWCVIAVANLMLCALILTSPRHSIYDETWFIGTLDLLRIHGFSRAFLLEYPGAPGPTFTIIYTGIQNLLHLSYPWLRLVSLTFMLACAALIGLLLRIIAGSRLGALAQLGPALTAGVFTTMPGIGASAGMTLTEMPSMMIMVAALVGSCVMLRFDDRRMLAAALALPCGALLAAAVLGRQNYLVVLPCLFLLVGMPNGVPNRRELVYLGAVATVAFLFVVSIFAVWGGLVPKHEAGSGFSFVPWHGVLSAGYSGFVAALLCPDIFRELIVRRSQLLLAVLVGLALALLFGAPMAPMRSVVTRIGGTAMAEWVGTGVAFLLALVAASFLLAMCHHLWQYRNDRIVRFAGVAAVLGILSNVKITWQFSSRYMMVFAPLLILALAPAMRATWHLPVRLAVGAAISLVSLASYYAIK
jgi:hypothetical protein